MSGNVYELGRVPLLSILGMAVSAIVSIGIAVAALIIIYKKTKGKLISSLIGAVTFIVLVLFVEQLLHQVLFSLFPDFFLGNRFVYAVYGGLAAAVFEEFGRLLAMGVIMKKFLTKQNSLLYGVGHGGAEAVILGGMNGISNIMFSLLINAGIMEKLLGGILSSQAPALAAQLSPLWLQPSYMFLIAPVERIGAFVLQICLSYFVYRSIRNRNAAYFILALGIHFTVGAGIVLAANAMPLLLVEALFLIVVAQIAAGVFLLYRFERAKKEPAPEIAPAGQEIVNG